MDSSKLMMSNVYYTRSFILKKFKNTQKLVGVTHMQEILPGVNIAQCFKHEGAPEENCTCGFYAYLNWSETDLYTHRKDHVRAIVKGSGKTIIQENGVRVEKIEVVALASEDIQTREFLQKLFPNIEIFESDFELHENTKEKFPIKDFSSETFSPGPSSKIDLGPNHKSNVEYVKLKKPGFRGILTYLNSFLFMFLCYLGSLGVVTQNSLFGAGILLGASGVGFILLAIISFLIEGFAWPLSSALAQMNLVASFLVVSLSRFENQIVLVLGTTIVVLAMFLNFTAFSVNLIRSFLGYSGSRYSYVMKAKVE